MPDPGRAAEDRRVIARQSWLQHPALNSLAIPVATNEALASFLPGRVNGPADAYRHIVWVAELTRRMGPDTAGSLAELHEIQGQMSAARRNMVGQGSDVINDAERRPWTGATTCSGSASGCRRQASTMSCVCREKPWSAVQEMGQGD